MSTLMRWKTRHKKSHNERQIRKSKKKFYTIPI